MAEHDLGSVAFPTLDDAQLSALERCGGATLKKYSDGQTLIKAGDRDFRFYVVKSGEIEILDDSGDAPKTLAVLKRGEFTGDVAHLTGGPSLITATARGDCEAFTVSSEGVREIINRFPDLGDVILQALIARRHLLRESGEFTGLRVIGSRYSRDTHRIREFLSKNRVPFTWLDLEADPQVKELLKQSGVSESETPIVAWGRKLILRNPSDRALAEALGIRQPLEQTVYDLVRGDSLFKDMSAYLARRIEQTPNIEIRLNTEVRQMHGDTGLREVEIVDKKTGETRTLKTPALFSFIGAQPRTDWLPQEIERDEKGFVRTGFMAAQSPRWTAKRPPFLLETTCSGVFAAGDVRSGSAKRVASAVGEGAMAVMLVHEYLREM